MAKKKSNGIVLKHRCLGRSKSMAVRCGNKTSFLVCRFHRWQLAVFLFVTIPASALVYRELFKADAEGPVSEEYQKEQYRNTKELLDALIAEGPCLAILFTDSAASVYCAESEVFLKCPESDFYSLYCHRSLWGIAYDLTKDELDLKSTCIAPIEISTDLDTFEENGIKQVQVSGFAVQPRCTTSLYAPFYIQDDTLINFLIAASKNIYLPTEITTELSFFKTLEKRPISLDKCSKKSDFFYVLNWHRPEVLYDHTSYKEITIEHTYKNLQGVYSYSTSEEQPIQFYTFLHHLTKLFAAIDNWLLKHQGMSPEPR